MHLQDSFRGTCETWVCCDVNNPQQPYNEGTESWFNVMSNHKQGGTFQKDLRHEMVVTWFAASKHWRISRAAPNLAVHGE